MENDFCALTSAISEDPDHEPSIKGLLEDIKIFEDSLTFEGRFNLMMETIHSYRKNIAILKIETDKFDKPSKLDFNVVPKFLKRLNLPHNIFLNYCIIWRLIHTYHIMIEHNEKAKEEDKLDNITPKLFLGVFVNQYLLAKHPTANYVKSNDIVEGLIKKTFTC